MPYYESVFISRQDLSSTQADQLADQMAQIVSDNGGQVKGREYWGLKNLAYRIRKNRKGHFTMFHLNAPSAAVLEMERNMGLSEDILRHLTIRLDELPEGPSIMMQKNNDRNDRGRRSERYDDRSTPPGHDQKDYQSRTPSQKETKTESVDN